MTIPAHCFVDANAHIETDVTLHPGAYIGPNVHIESGVIVGPGVIIGDAAQPALQSGITSIYIKSGAVIGAGAIVLPGVTINKGVIVAPGTLVTSTLPPYAVVSGTPARITGYVEGLPRTTRFENSKDIPEGEAVRRLGIGDVTLHRLKRVEDIRGNLSVGEFPADIPFMPARYFLVFDVPSEKTRGEHAHKVCKQFLVCVRGSCAVVVDDGASRCEVCLNAPNLGLYIPPMVWGIQYKFTPDGVLLVFASDAYNPADYIRDYADFQQWVMMR